MIDNNDWQVRINLLNLLFELHKEASLTDSLVLNGIVDRLLVDVEQGKIVFSLLDSRNVFHILRKRTLRGCEASPPGLDNERVLLEKR
jgi:hypothetical protein